MKGHCTPNPRTNILKSCLQLKQNKHSGIPKGNSGKVELRMSRGGVQLTTACTQVTRKRMYELMQEHCSHLHPQNTQTPDFQSCHTASDLALRHGKMEVNNHYNCQDPSVTNYTCRQLEWRCPLLVAEGCQGGLVSVNDLRLHQRRLQRQVWGSALFQFQRNKVNNCTGICWVLGTLPHRKGV